MEPINCIIIMTKYSESYITTRDKLHFSDDWAAKANNQFERTQNMQKHLKWQLYWKCISPVGLLLSEPDSFDMLSADELLCVSAWPCL